MADLIITTATLTYAGLGFARLVALFAQRAGVALFVFADISTFACIAFNDEGATH